MVIVAVKDEQLIFTLRTRYCMEIEVLNPIHAFFISSLLIISYYNTLGGWKVVLLILISEVVLPS